MADEVVDELVALLGDCEIGMYTLETEDKILTISYKEDFDEFYPRLGPDIHPRVLDRKQDMSGDLPYGATYWAFFHYKGWKIRGNIVKHKPEIT